jgi:hypothetical protein
MSFGHAIRAARAGNESRWRTRLPNPPGRPYRSFREPDSAPTYVAVALLSISESTCCIHGRFRHVCGKVDVRTDREASRDGFVWTRFRLNEDTDMKATLKKLAATGLVALTIGGSIAVTSTPAAADWHHHGGWGGGGGVAAGIIGGLALGAIAGSAANGYYGGGPAYGYAPAYGCRIRPRPVYDGWGNYLGTRPTRVCY